MTKADRRVAALAALFATVAVHAQEVHKCTVNGAVTYQARPCASGDMVLPTAPTPSDQETRQALADLQRQRRQAATGWIWRQSVVPPPPPPSPPPAPPSSTTIIVLPDDAADAIIIRRKHKRATSTSTSTSTGTPPPPPLNNCEKLNRDNAEAADRLQQLRAPSELASHDQLLQKAQADVARIQQLAAASNCRLKP
jgi:hypothetical protein